MADEIPKVQTAAVVTSKGEEIQIKKDQPVKQPSELAPGECLVKLEATGVCHTGAPLALSSCRRVLDC
jgi:propanol-preferring alcohol dehydrogenase